MAQTALLAVIKDQTQRTLWSLHNVIDCIPNNLWSKLYCDLPLWKHVYHTLHSLDRWYINPSEYKKPEFHKDGLNDLNTPAEGFISKSILEQYAFKIDNKIKDYLNTLTEETLSEKSAMCSFMRFQLILAQHRHVDMHIGMLMGF